MDTDLRTIARPLALPSAGPDPKVYGGRRIAVWSGAAVLGVAFWASVVGAGSLLAG